MCMNKKLILYKLLTLIVLCFSAIVIKSESCAARIACGYTNANCNKQSKTDKSYYEKVDYKNDVFIIKI